MEMGEGGKEGEEEEDGMLANSILPSLPPSLILCALVIKSRLSRSIITL